MCVLSCAALRVVANYHPDPQRGGVVEKTLRWDSERLIEEYEATKEGLREAVIGKYKSLARERAEVCDRLLHHKPTHSPTSTKVLTRDV